MIESEFEYPRKPWTLPLVCHCWFLTLLVLLFYHHVPMMVPGDLDQEADVFSTFVFSHPYEIMIVSYILWASVLIWNWPARLFGQDRKIILHQDGITIHKKFTLWDDVTQIRHGPVFLREKIVLLKLKKKKVRFFSLPRGDRRRAVVLEARPFIFRDVIPAIRAIRPDIPISTATKRLLDKPDSVGRSRTWLAGVFLILNVSLLSVILWSNQPSLARHLILCAPLIYSSLIALTWVMGTVRTGRESFIQFALQCSLFAPFAIQFHLWHSVAHLAIEVLLITIIMTSVLAFAVLVATRRLSKVGQICVVAALVVSSTVTYWHCESQVWPMEDISHLNSDKALGTPLWGSSGKYLTTFSLGDTLRVLHIPTLERRYEDKREGAGMVGWMGERFLIRTIRVDQDNAELWAYDFDRGIEIHIPAANDFHIGRVQPVSENGCCLAWVDSEEDGTVETLRIWNLETMKEEFPPVSLPCEIRWAIGSATWVGDERIVIYGATRSMSNTFNMLHLTPGSMERKLLTSAHKYEKWYPTADFRYALGINRKESEGYELHFVDLQTDKSKLLPGEFFPIISSSLNCALRVGEHQGRPYLMRLDFETGEDVPLRPALTGMKLIGVTRKGTSVLFGPKEFLNMSHYVIAHLPSGRQQRIYLPYLFGGLASAEMIAFSPNSSPFSPDDRHFVLQGIQVGGLRTFLYKLPASW